MVSKMLIFENCLPLKEPLTVTVGEARAQTSRKCAVVQSHQKTQITLVALIHFHFKIITSNAHFRGFPACKKNIDGYIQ